MQRWEYGERPTELYQRELEEAGAAARGHLIMEFSEDLADVSCYEHILLALGALDFNHRFALQPDVFTFARKCETAFLEGGCVNGVTGYHRPGQLAALSRSFGSQIVQWVKRHKRAPSQDDIERCLSLGIVSDD